jgi:glucan phosphoethanolaminetransferase (alkaline phosphatase superfamily)
MSWAHIHLALNHVPVIGLLIALLLLAVASLRRSTELTRVSYALLVLLAATAVVVYFTGEPAEELIENLPGFSEAIVEEHEEVALIATIGMVILGLVALVGLIRFRAARIAPAWYGRGVLLLALLMGGVMVWTANLGGQIRHSEIRAGGGATLDNSRQASDRPEQGPEGDN